MKNCPNCGFCLAAPKKAKPGKVSKRLSHINAYGKPIYFSRAMNMIMDARARGDFRPFIPTFNLEEYIERAREWQETWGVMAKGDAFTPQETAVTNLYDAAWRDNMRVDKERSGAEITA